VRQQKGRDRIIEEMPVAESHRQPTVDSGEQKSSYTIMLVEDDREIGRLMRFLFELEGLHVVATDDYDEVLPLLHQALPDVVLMDVLLQGQQTIELMRQMRQSDGDTARIPVVMTSAVDYGPECLQAGADHFILKPFLPDEVVQEVIDLSRRRADEATHNCPGTQAQRETKQVDQALTTKLSY
jgi:CheY-like chemotaxis protein